MYYACISASASRASDSVAYSIPSRTNPKSEYISATSLLSVARRVRVELIGDCKQLDTRLCKWACYLLLTLVIIAPFKVQCY